MTKDDNRIIKSMRDYLYDNDMNVIDAMKISEGTGIPFSKLIEIAPTPRDLVRKVFAYEIIEFAAIFDEYHFEEQNAIDVLIIVGQEVYKKFHDVNPAVSYHLKSLYPDLYYEHLDNKIDFMVEHVINNLKKGQNQGIYKERLDVDELRNKLIKNIAKVHDHEILSSGQLTFAIVFNEVIENFIRESTDNDWWSYYKQRKQLFEALDFNR